MANILENSPQAGIEDLIRADVRALKAYQVVPASGLIKLDAMENPYSWPDDLVGEWQQFLAGAALNRYPDGHAIGVKRMLRETAGIGHHLGLLLGNGSDEIIQMLMLAVQRDRPVLAPVPSFVMYEVSARSVGLPFIGVPLKPDFSLDLERMLDVVASSRPALVFIAYPNNPTGNLFSEVAIERLIRATDGLVVIDEAYFPFAQRTFMGRLGEFRNLLVMRTLSKEGLAGLRLGFLAGDALWINELDKIRLPYNINILTQLTVEFALRHAPVLQLQAERIRVERDRLFDALSIIPGVQAWRSDANFILFRVSAADEVFEGIRRRGVLIKNLGGSGLKGFLRVTVGTVEENACFLEALRRTLEPS